MVLKQTFREINLRWKKDATEVSKGREDTSKPSEWPMTLFPKDGEGKIEAVLEIWNDLCKVYCFFKYTLWLQSQPVTSQQYTSRNKNSATLSCISSLLLSLLILTLPIDG